MYFVASRRSYKSISMRDFLQFFDRQTVNVGSGSNENNLHEIVSSLAGIPVGDFYLVSNGKIVRDDYVPTITDIIHVYPRIRGGKGGFGSMLRAIGAQIEKTTNREACRDLSGRRLRDINEEKRLKTWLAQKEERDREAEEKRRKKLQRLLEEPKVELKDDTFIKECKEMKTTISNAFEQGLQASCSAPAKRKCEESVVLPKKRKTVLDDSDDDLSDESGDGEEIDARNSTSENDQLSVVTT